MGSGTTGYAIFDEEFKCISKLKFPKSKTTMVYAALSDEILTFVYGNGVNNEKDIKMVCHIPFQSSKEYTVFDNAKNFLKGDL